MLDMFSLVTRSLRSMVREKRIQVTQNDHYRIGGAEYVSSDVFEPFHYTALGHLHQAHFVGNELTIRYSGSPLKYSISEENHQKGYLIVQS